MSHSNNINNSPPFQHPTSRSPTSSHLASVAGHSSNSNSNNNNNTNNPNPNSRIHSNTNNTTDSNNTTSHSTTGNNSTNNNNSTSSMNPTSMEPFNMEDSILMDFSELDTLTDFFPTTALLLHGNNSNNNGQPHSSDHDDFLTNSDQWSSISNLIHVNTNTINNNNNDSNINNNNIDAPVVSHPNTSHTNHPMNSSSNSNPIVMTTNQNSFTFRDDDRSGGGGLHSNSLGSGLHLGGGGGGGGVDGSSTTTTDGVPRIPTAVYTASTVPVPEPNPNDVLLGRGGKNNQWSGNETLREMARNMSTMYAAAPKRNKPAIAMLLVQQMRALIPAGRFLKQDQAMGAWIEVDEEVAREKASQCLRDIVAVMTKIKSVSSMVDCSGGISNNMSMSMLKKVSKSTTSLRNATFSFVPTTTSTGGHGTSNATFPVFSNPAMVSSSSTSTLTDRMNSSNIGGGSGIQLRGSVARFFDTPNNNNNKTKNESASNLLSGVTSASRTAAQSGLALLRAKSVATKMNATDDETSGAASGNFRWNPKSSNNAMSSGNNNIQPNNDINQPINAMSSMNRLPQGSQSATARAGLALLQHGSGMGTSTATGPSSLSNSNNENSNTSSNANMSRVVSSMYSSNNSIRNMIPQQQQVSSNLPARNSFISSANMGMSTSNAMQISSNNLRDINQTSQQQQQQQMNSNRNSNTISNSNNGGGSWSYANAGTQLNTHQQQQQQQQQHAQQEQFMSRQSSKRNLISASAPNLGEISLFLAKRRRPMVNAPWANNDGTNTPSFPGNNDNSHSDDMGNAINQRNDHQLLQRSTNISSNGQIPNRAASMISLGANATTMGGNAVYQMSGVGQHSNASNDPLLQRFHELRSHLLAAPASIENNMDHDNSGRRRLSCVSEQQESRMPNMVDPTAVTDDNRHAGFSTSSRSSNMFASLLQQPRLVNAVASASSTNHPHVPQQQQLPGNPHHNHPTTTTSNMNQGGNFTTTTTANTNTTTMDPTAGSGDGGMAPTDHHHQHPINILPNTNTNPFDCFTGMGDAMGDSDDTALQRWIDNMADEELS